MSELLPGREVAIKRVRADARTGELELIWVVGAIEYWFCCTKVKPRVWEYDLGERSTNSTVPYLMIALDWLIISTAIQQAFKKGYLTQSQVLKSGCYPNLILK